VDIVANGAIHKGMPHKYYHGKTGRIWNVTPRAVGVEVNKVVGNRIVVKRIHVRVEHVRPSKCKQEGERRVKRNEILRSEARKAGTIVDPNLLRRQPKQPLPGKLVVRRRRAETVFTTKYELLM